MPGTEPAIQASVLGQLLLMQSVVNNLPDEDSIFGFVCQGLKDIPGVAEVRRSAAGHPGPDPGVTPLPIRTGRTSWGELMVTVSDQAAFAPYRDYLNNFCFMLAVILEERSQRRLIESNKAQLEERVQERTRQLTELAALRRQTEKELGQNRMMLEYILDAVPQSIFWKDRHSVYLGCNQAFARGAGLEHPDDIIGKTDFDLPWLKEETEAYRRDDRTVMEQNSPKLHIIERQLRADGEHLWVDTNKIPLVDAQGTVMGVLGIYADITSRKLAEEALQESEAKYRRLHESIMDGFVLVRMDGVIVESNISYQAMTGYSAEELTTRTYMDLTPARWHGFEASIIQDQLLTRGYTDVYEKEYRHKNGTVFPVELRAYLLRDPEGTPSGMWAVVRDIGERKRLMEVMIQSEKMMSVGGLAAGMAHEINNPLSGIIQGAQVVVNRLNLESRASLQAAQEAGIDPENLHRFLTGREIPEMVESIRESAVRAARIVASMLEFSRKSDSAKLPVDVNALLDKAVALSATDYDLKKKYDFRRIAITREYAQDLPQVPCSTVQIQQVFLNLLGNAAQAMAGRAPDLPPAAIILRTMLEGDTIRIEVQDNGPGMDESTRRRIFEPFFTTKAVGEGTGLGLSVSYFIVVNNHGGSIEADSSPEWGTRFTIRLPLRPGSAPPARACG